MRRISLTSLSPSRQELIISALKAAGRVTLMCGDGTNDVGALKQAHVGVSIINSPELEKRVNRRLKTSPSAAKDKKPVGRVNTSSVAAAARQQLAQLQAEDEAGGGGAEAGTSGGMLESARRAYAELEEQDMDPTLVRLGDASIASPFTSKRTSVDCILAVSQHSVHFAPCPPLPSQSRVLMAVVIVCAWVVWVLWAERRWCGKGVARS